MTHCSTHQTVSVSFISLRVTHHLSALCAHPTVKKAGRHAHRTAFPRRHGAIAVCTHPSSSACDSAARHLRIPHTPDADLTHCGHRSCLFTPFDLIDGGYNERFRLSGARVRPVWRGMRPGDLHSQRTRLQLPQVLERVVPSRMPGKVPAQHQMRKVRGAKRPTRACHARLTPRFAQESQDGIQVPARLRQGYKARFALQRQGASC